MSSHPKQHDCCGAHAPGACAGIDDPKPSSVPGVEATWRFQVAEMDCQEEVGLLRGALGTRPGILALRFDLIDRRLEVDIAQGGPSATRVASWIREVGLTPRNLALGTSPVSLSEADLAPQLATRRAETIVGGVANAFGLIWSNFGLASLIGLPLSSNFSQETPAVLAHAIAVVVCGRRLLPRAWAALRLRRADMNVLMVVAVIGAMAIGEWSEAGLVTWLFAIALQLEQWSLGRAREAISRMMDLTPRTVRVVDDRQGLVERSVESVGVDQQIELRPGDRIPLDGTIEQGASDVDRSPLTGESLPESVSIGDEVWAGTINLTGSLRVRVTCVANETRLAQVLHAMREAQQRRGQTERWVDRFAEVYTPIMLVIAVLVALLLPWLTARSPLESIHAALVLLVTACPCALVISTPVTIVAALTAATRQGVVLRGGDALERLTEVNTFAFDKTGTLTRGQFRVAAIHPAAGRESAQVLALAALLERHSSHPLAQAIIAAAEEASVTEVMAGSELAAYLGRATSVIPGAGVESVDGGELAWVGNQRMLARQRINQEPATSNETLGTRIWIGVGHELWGSIELQDQERPEARQVLDALRSRGIRELVVLSGDRAANVAEIRRRLGADRDVAELLPDQKREEIERIKQDGRRVAMVGDGINDAVALAAANVGIALGPGGADVAKAAADVVMLHDSLARIPWALDLAHRARRILIQNLSVAIVSKLIFLALAITGLSTLWLAILADTGVSLAVIANALRMLTAKSGSS